MNLDGKTIILTGGARVGKKVAQYIYSKKANLVMSFYKNSNEANFDKPEIENSSKIIKVRADLSQEADAENLVEEALKEFGRVDALIHMAASYTQTPWDKLSEKTWDDSLNTIAKSAFLTGLKSANAIRKNAGEKVFYQKQESGTIKGKMIFISDWSVLTRPYRNYLPYNVAKAAIVGLTKSFAKELAPDILVNCIAPGPILRPNNLTDEENKEAMSQTPLARWGGDDEIAKAAIYLLDADFITGQLLTVDGGRTIG